MEDTPVRRIVVIRPGALGDTLLAFPALGWLGHRFPKADLTLIARADVLPLASQACLAAINWPYDLSDWAPLFADSPDVRGVTERARATFEQADLAIAWLSDPEGTVARNLRAIGVRRVLVGPGRPSIAQPSRHAALQLFDALRPLATQDAPLPRQVSDLLAYLPEFAAHLAVMEPAEDAWLAQHLPASVAQWEHPSRLVALHPGSGGAAKRWAPENFAALARLIASAGYQPLLIAGPQDDAMCANVLLGAPETPVARHLPVKTLATLLTRCAAYVGNDSGVSHLAGLLERPCVVIFGPTDPAVWAPVGQAIHVMRAPADDLARLAVEQVWDALGALLTEGREKM